VPLTITHIDMKDGTSVEVPPTGIIVFVGPNNAGKSLLLREAIDWLTTAREDQILVRSLRIAKNLTSPELIEQFKGKGQRWVQLDGQAFLRHGAISVHESNVRICWDQGPPFRDAAQLFFLFAASTERLQLANGTPSFDAVTQLPSTPLQTLYVRPDLESQLNEICKAAFGSGVFINRFAGGQIHLHYGEPPAGPVTSPPHQDYLAKLKQIPLVENQGDGVKSFLGLMLALLATDYPVVVIDEPEAFLHPPQARLLGRQLSKMTPQGKQLLLATHSSDVLQGLLDAPDVSVTVVRISREGDETSFAVLSHDRMKKLWQDPLLRHSDILDGLFHPVTVLCEADADCRFYRACEEEIIGSPTDTHFAHCGGKDRLPMAYESLRGVGVDVRAILDMDALDREALLSKLVTLAGGDWSALRPDYNVVASAVKHTEQRPSLAFVKSELDRLIGSVESLGNLAAIEAPVRELFKSQGGWRGLKLGGAHALPGGNVTEAWQRLSGELTTLGIYLVPVGELERWIPQVPGHGPAWLTSVLNQRLHRSPPEALRAFLEPITGGRRP
jgi:AAA domain, putative AbiEii toxin, Type IV TA system